MSSTFSVPSAHIFPAILLTSLVGFGMYFDFAASNGAAEQTATVREGELARQSASTDVRRLVQWTMSTQDHADMPFVVIDKANARLYVFDSIGHLRGSAPVLLAAAHADEATPAATPAGRFVADMPASASEGGIVWTNAAGLVSLHALAAARDGEQRRLDSPRVEDKRVSQGPLLVTATFYREYLDALRTQRSVAYVLPEASPLERVFGRTLAQPAAVVEQAETVRRPS